jgi:flagellum-specific ATP synthase
MLPAIRAYLQQGMNEPMPMQRCVQELAMVMSPPPQAQHAPQGQNLRRTP